MVKIVSGLADKLTEARKTIEELKSQNEVLIRENEVLRASAGFSTPKSSSRAPSTDSSNHGTRQKETGYDKPTKASVNRAIATRKPKESVEKVQRAEIQVGFLTYTYVDGKPIQTGPGMGYMAHTVSSYHKESTKPVGKKRSTETWGDWNEDENADTPNNDKSPDEDQSLDDTDEVDVTQEPNLLSAEEIYNLVDNEDSLWKLFPGFRFQISSDDGYEFLSIAHRTAQEAFRDAAHKFWPRLWEYFRASPRLVKLGRLEIESYVGEYGTWVDFSLCGTKASVVHGYLLDIVYLRNAVCHPSKILMQDAKAVDNHLKDVLKLTLALGDEERSEYMRSQRTKLCQLATDSFDEINSFAPLTRLPLATGEGGPHWKDHHIDMFSNLLRNWTYRDDEEKELYSDMYQVAEAWETKKGVSIPRD